MSMLAERKRKQKWSLNPRGKYWTEDSNKFGQKLLEKMGWSVGKGLGANEDGAKEHVKVSYKYDTKGMGYKETEEWTEHDSNFSKLLENLSDSKMVDGGTSKLRSLEEKSQNSRVRVHYHKFTRGKDLSRYSEKDLANIFGKKSLNEIKENKSDSIGVENEIVQDPNFVHKGSIVDYFKRKLGKFENGNVVSETVKKSDSVNGEKEENEKKKKSKKRKYEETFVSYLNEVDREGEGNENAVKGKKKKKNKIRNEEDSIEIEEESEETFQVEKKKEEIDIEEISEQNYNHELEMNGQTIEGKKRKKKKKSEGVKNVEEMSEGIEGKDNAEINENFEFEGDTQNEYQGKRKKKIKTKAKEESGGLCNPGFEDLDVLVGSKKKIKIENMEKDERTKDDLVNSHEVKPKKKKKLENGLVNPSFDNDAIDKQGFENLEVKRKCEKSRKNQNVGVYNPSFEGQNEEKMIGRKRGIVIVEEESTNPPEDKPKKKKKKSFDEGSVDISSETLANLRTKKNFEELNPDKVINPFEVKPKKKKSGLVNPSFDGETIEVPCQNLEILEVKREKNEECEGFDNPGLKLEDEPTEDLMLNVVMGEPSDLLKKKKKKKQIRFSEVNQEIIIPNNEENVMEEKIQSMSRAIEKYQAEVENDMNEEKSRKSHTQKIIKRSKIINPASNVVGEIGEVRDTHEKLNYGTRLSFKNVRFETTRWCKNSEDAMFEAKKSYKHLIGGDIIVQFKNTNLHQISGYATQPECKNTVQ